MPLHFEQAFELVSEDAAVENVPCGPDPSQHFESIESFREAGFDRIYVHQIGPDQADAIEFFEEGIVPSFR